jgi:glycerol kinase
MEQYILSIDQSTSATKAILFDSKGGLVHRCNAEHGQYYPQPGWVEHDPVVIYENTVRVIGEVIRDSGVDQHEIKVLAVTNQRETVVVWDKNTGKPVYNALVWQCQRAGEICRTIAAKGFGSVVKEKTGLVLSPYFSAAKVKWILDHVEGAREKADNRELLMGTIDSWLIWNLTGRKVHATDYSNASRTQLFNIKELKWDEELLNIFTIPASMLPDVKYSDEIFGYTSAEQGLDREIPISGILGDSHAALFGQNCFGKGMAKATYGTGSSIMMNLGGTPLDSRNGLVTSVAWGMNGTVEFVFEGNINCTGATIKWLADDMELIKNPKEAEYLAFSVSSNEGVYLVPAFVGLGAPYWDSDAKASITGITRSAKKANIVRAAEESIAYQIKDVLELMIAEAGIELQELRVDGGPTRDGFLMQFQADMLDTAVACSKIEELSALGSCMMAGLAAGIWKNREEIEKLREPGRVFVPAMMQEQRSSLYKGWKEAVERTMSKRPKDA